MIQRFVWPCFLLQFFFPVVLRSSLSFAEFDSSYSNGCHTVKQKDTCFRPFQPSSFHKFSGIWFCVKHNIWTNCLTSSNHQVLNGFQRKKINLLLLIKVCGNWIFDVSGHLTTWRSFPRHVLKQMYQKIFVVHACNKNDTTQLQEQTDVSITSCDYVLHTGQTFKYKESRLYPATQEEHFGGGISMRQEAWARKVL